MKFLSFFFELTRLTTCQTLTYLLDPFRNVVVCKRRAYERDLIEKKKDTTSMLFQAHNGQNKKRERGKSETYFSFLFFTLSLYCNGAYKHYDNACI
jgi:hypothetical protein